MTVTEIAGDEVTQEQIARLCNRYYWAGKYCAGKDVLEAACGTGQGLGYLHKIARSLDAGDYSEKMLSIASQHYSNRILLRQFDAQNMPFNDLSKDVIILFEAIYYLPDAKQFAKECARILRPSGVVLVATANKDLYDFNPSPYSYKYYGVMELNELFSSVGFQVRCYGDTPVSSVPLTQKLLRPVKKMAVSLDLMPKSMAGKKILKRLVFGDMVTMPAEITPETSTYIPPAPITTERPDSLHKVIYCEAVKE